MPPNRKANVDVSENLSQLNLQAHVKFAPLTAEQSSSSPAADVPTPTSKPEVKATPQAQAKQQQMTYWDWPANFDRKQYMIDQILEEEKARQRLSVKHVERKLEEHVHPESTGNTNPTFDGYWNWKVETKTHDDHYWHWPTSQEESKQEQIQKILEEERLRQLFSVDHIQANIQAAAH